MLSTEMNSSYLSKRFSRESKTALLFSLNRR
nr:MAG TPA: hypothetical protein [Caudoviricetes sp.]